MTIFYKIDKIRLYSMNHERREGKGKGKKYLERRQKR